MEIEYSSKKLEKDCTSNLIKTYGLENAKKIKQRLEQLKAFENLQQAYTLRSMFFEPLSGDRKGEYSIVVNKNWRIILTAVPKNESSLEKVKIVKIEKIEDYH